MELNAKHLQIIDLLVDSRFSTGDDDGKTQKQIAEEVGVRQEQISRWKKDPDFSAVLEDRTSEYRRGIEQVSFTVRRHRLAERVRLLRSMPDTDVKITITEKVEKRETVYLQPQKNRILDSIEREMEAAEVEMAEETIGELRREIAALKGGNHLIIQEKQG